MTPPAPSAKDGARVDAHPLKPGDYDGFDGDLNDDGRLDTKELSHLKRNDFERHQRAMDADKDGDGEDEGVSTPQPHAFINHTPSTRNPIP
jgi:hypothetical protein